MRSYANLADDKNRFKFLFKNCNFCFLKRLLMGNNLHLRFASALLVLSTTLAAQQQPVESKISGFAQINFAELAKKELQHPTATPAQRSVPFRTELSNGMRKERSVTGNATITEINIPESNLSQPPVASPAPIKTFTGIKDDNTVIPPDVMGAAGPNHLMETLNNFYRIFSKTGSAILKIVPSTFWSAFGTYEGDPHIAFDSLSGRWIHCCIGQLTNNHWAIFVAASQSSDPTGNWFIYSIDIGTSIFPDYPLLGFNKRWVVITTNDFVGNSFSRVRIMVLNKSKFLAGTLTSVKTFFDNDAFTISPAETLDPAQTTEYLLSDYNGNSGGKGFVKLGSITGTTSSPVYNAGSIIGVNKPWSEIEVDEPQKGSSGLIDGGDTRMGKTIVRNGSLWATQTIFLPASSPTRSSVQYWQINPSTLKVTQLGRLDDATGANRFAFPSIAVTASNDVLIGCSRFGSAIFASAAYAYRNHADALNTLRSFFTYKAGGNSYFKTFGGSRNRWGDYSATCIDYTDGTFWTLQEYAMPTANMWGTWWANVGAATFAFANTNTNAAVNAPGTFHISPNPARATATLRWQSSTSGAAMLSISDAQGNTVYRQKMQLISGVNQQRIPIQNLSSGTYFVTLSVNGNIQRTKLVVEK